MVKAGIRARMRQGRLNTGLTQQGLASRAGVSLGTLKKFEATGDIALETLLKLSLVLGGLDDFDKVMSGEVSFPSREELLQEPKLRKRGRRI
jgi:transcriptional regulator with XRE-family HTH domain